MGMGPSLARRAASAVGRGLGWLLDIGVPVLYVVAIVALTRWVAEEGGLLLFLATCTVTVIGMTVSQRLHDYRRHHPLPLGARILVRFGPVLLLTVVVYSIASATTPTPAISGWFVGLLVWSLGMRVSFVRELIRERAGKEAQ